MEYEPIDCNLYDYIEHFATHKHLVRLEFLSENGVRFTIFNQIIDTETTAQKEEYLILSNGRKIRLDLLIRIEEIRFNGTKC